MRAYEKLQGSIDQLVRFTDKSFDLVLCHNVLEYIDPNVRKDYLLEFKRILKDDGLILIIKHNHVGKVLQSVVFANTSIKHLAYSMMKILRAYLLQVVLLIRLRNY